jgi:Histidine kinase-, DNA gyrase B-, and HSP90-like ATPase
MTRSTMPVFIGADVLEIMSIAMYAEPLVIYRELIQNSADAIDAAASSGLIKPSEARVAIRLDVESRTASIFDNGIGLSNDAFDAQMLSFGASAKRTSTLRGFRGIGRLAGLGQCQTLVFRSRGAGDHFVREARWSALRARELISSHEVMPLEELAAESVELSSERAAGEPEHFFEVRLEGLRRLADDRLVDAYRICRYLSEVAPVPFAPQFSRGEDIREALLRRGPLLELQLTVNDHHVLKPYRDEVEVRAGRTARITDVDYVELPAVDDGTAAYGWIAHHDYLGALRRESPGRGLRVRSGNLQIGDETLFAAAFPEERFNAWAIGEFHVFDARLRPNARRDAFEPSVHVDNLYNQLGPYAASIARRCRQQSKSRNRSREVEALTGTFDAVDDALGRDASPFAVTLRRLVASSVQQSIAEFRADGSADDRTSEISSVERRASRLAKRRTEKKPSARELGRLDVLKWLHANASPTLFTSAIRALRKAR